MKHNFKGWDDVATKLCDFALDPPIELNIGQKASLRALAARLPENGVIIADEVGMGKTRIAAVLTKAVIAAGGRVAVLVPPGLGYQWGDELQSAGVEAPQILRSLRQYFMRWDYESDCKEITPSPWFEESVLVISHAFTNWRLGENSDSWRWALLPELYAQWRKENTNRLPNGYKGHENLGCYWPKNAAEDIINAITGSPKKHLIRRIIKEIEEKTSWPDVLSADKYGRNENLRPWLEKSVGLGLGVFDLVIIDEAHKSRGLKSNLERMLNNVFVYSEAARSLAMTATPVELDAKQWVQMLKRVRVDEAQTDLAITAISDYVNAVNRVRLYSNDAGIREEYRNAAKSFKSKLDGFILRRDKREDAAVINFQEASGDSYHRYRREKEILIDTEELSFEWKQAVCAAEALSFVTRQADQSLKGSKRLRLTLGNGHGIAALLDELHKDKTADQRQEEADQEGLNNLETEQVSEQEEIKNKRLERAVWWQKVLTQPFEKNFNEALFNHPAILKVAEEIEKTCQLGEKVLVFGKFTRPMRALVQLLNAREMLRCMDENHFWPQSKISEEDEEVWSAMQAAHKQLGKTGTLDQELLNEKLAAQYHKLENQRRSFRDKLITSIEEGFQQNKASEKVILLFEAFKDNATSLADVARAMQELLGLDVKQVQPEHFAQAFTELISALTDRDDSDSDAELDADKALEKWNDLAERLSDEYNRPEGGFARLMNGETAPHTRRLLQLAFNRRHAYPKVLVAQSVVGREGLNLHKACRTVVLLHPEWNPGVVEQQIGRVDRLGSLWEEKLKEAIDSGKSKDELPRIKICPVVFKGTYDEINWEVLNQRWDDLRAQLHGIVISPRLAENHPGAKEIIEEINFAAPNFSPLI